MLDKIKEQHEQIFIKEFEKDFGENFQVEVDWGFPNLILTISSEENNVVIIYRFFINAIEKSFNLETLGYTINEEVKTPKAVSIEGKILSYIVSKALQIYERSFEEETAKKGSDKAQ